MKFKNETEITLKFNISEFEFEVGPEAVCEIPDKYSYIVASRGLPMKPIGELPKPKEKKQKFKGNSVSIGNVPKGVVLELGESMSETPIDSEK